MQALEWNCSRASGSNPARVNTPRSVFSEKESEADVSDVTARFRLRRARASQKIQRKNEAMNLNLLAQKYKDPFYINDRVNVVPVDDWLQTLPQHPLAEGLCMYVVRKGQVVGAVFRFPCTTVPYVVQLSEPFEGKRIPVIAEAIA